MSVWKPSVTVAAIIHHRGSFLMVEEDTAEGLRLNQPAGHLDPDESLIEAVVRETLEETARPFTPTAFLGAYMSRYRSARNGDDVTYVRFGFIGDVAEAIAGRALDTGIRQTVWMTTPQLRASEARHRSPLVMQCVDDYLAGRRLPLESVYTHPSIYGTAQ
jgi:8-oxo-dGTP pyrophosphatase MutT (NUDIX family)